MELDGKVSRVVMVVIVVMVVTVVGEKASEFGMIVGTLGRVVKKRNIWSMLEICVRGVPGRLVNFDMI